MSDLILDENNDIQFDNNDLVFFEADDKNLIAQRIEIKLRNHKTEWFLDINNGIPWIQEVLSRNNSKDLADTLIKREVLLDPDVKTILSYTSRITNRTLVAHIEAKLVDDSIISINGEING